jgi:hypothetical protein
MVTEALKVIHVPAFATSQVQNLTLRFGQVRPSLNPKGRGFCAVHRLITPVESRWLESCVPRMMPDCEVICPVEL